MPEDKAQKPAPWLRLDYAKPCDINYEPSFNGLSDKEVKEIVFEVLGEEFPDIAVMIIAPRRQALMMSRYATVHRLGSLCAKCYLDVPVFFMLERRWRHGWAPTSS